MTQSENFIESNIDLRSWSEWMINKHCNLHSSLDLRQHDTVITQYIHICTIFSTQCHLMYMNTWMNEWNSLLTQQYSIDTCIKAVKHWNINNRSRWVSNGTEGRSFKWLKWELSIVNCSLCRNENIRWNCLYDYLLSGDKDACTDFIALLRQISFNSNLRNTKISCMLT